MYSILYSGAATPTFSLSGLSGQDISDVLDLSNPIERRISNADDTPIREPIVEDQYQIQPAPKKIPFALLLAVFAALYFS